MRVFQYPMLGSAQPHVLCTGPSICHVVTSCMAVGVAGNGCYHMRPFAVARSDYRCFLLDGRHATACMRA